MTILLLVSFPIVLLILAGMKAVIGFHFPWETCACCGKKYKEHKPRP